jgi:hypothetical protein
MFLIKKKYLFSFTNLLKNKKKNSFSNVLWKNIYFSTFKINFYNSIKFNKFFSTKKEEEENKENINNEDKEVKDILQEEFDEIKKRKKRKAEIEEETVEELRLRAIESIKQTVPKDWLYLSERTKEAIYQIHMSDQKKWNLDEISRKFKIKRQLAAGIILLKAREYDLEKKLGKKLNSSIQEAIDEYFSDLTFDIIPDGDIAPLEYGKETFHFIGTAESEVDQGKLLKALRIRTEPNIEDIEELPPELKPPLTPEGEKKKRYIPRKEPLTWRQCFDKQMERFYPPDYKPYPTKRTYSPPYYKQLDNKNPEEAHKEAN